MTLPLPNPQRPIRTANLGPGVWRATVTLLDPLRVVIPLFGGTILAFDAELFCDGTGLAVGDFVGVSRIGGTAGIAVICRA